MKTELYQALYDGLVKYSPIPFEEFQKLIKISKICNLEKGDHFVQSGQKPNSIGFVVSGILRLYYINNIGEEFNKSFCVEGDFVASYSALLQNKESRLSVQALENTSLLEIAYSKYVELLKNHPSWQVLGRILAENLFIKKEQKESQFLLDSAETRYLEFLKEYPYLERRIKQYHIASYLGITPVALSRIRAKLKDS